MDYKTPDQYYGKPTVKPQETQPNQQIYNKWYNFFANYNTASLGYRAQANIPINSIRIPEDDTEREIAQKAANDYINWYKANYKQLVQQEKNNGKSWVTAGAVYDNRANIARSFLRMCASYIKKRDKQNTKELRNLYKQGAGSFSEKELTGTKGNIVSIVDAANNNALSAVAAYKKGSTEELKAITNKIQDQLSDPTFKTVFTYKYYSQTGRDVSNLQLKYDDIMRDYNEAKAGNSNMANSLGFNNQNLAGRSYDYLQKQKQQKQQGGQ